MLDVIETTPEGHTIRVTTQAHVDALEQNLREMDKLEIKSFNSTPHSALNGSYQNSDVSLTVMT